MKTKDIAKSAALTALLGLVKMAHADAACPSFTPVENLPPEDRQQISEKVSEMTKNINVDWDEIVVGINADGEIILCSKKQINMQTLGTFSTMSSMAKPESTK
jgi:hypothetical protein